MDKAVIGWGVTSFRQHSCLLPKENSAPASYPCKIAALLLLKESKNLATFTQEKARLILKQYFRRSPGYHYVRSARREFDALLYGEADCRLLYLPALTKRIRDAGHYCEYRTISAGEMRKLALKRAESEHDRRYKDDPLKPKFDPCSVDLSSIKDNRRYFYSWTFAPSSSIKQSYYLNEPNGEVDFCHSRNSIGGTYAYECTTDANRHIITRLAYYSIEDESSDVWTKLFRRLKEVYPNLNNECNVQKVDGARGCWAVFDRESRKLPWRDILHRSKNAASKFGAKYADIYKRVAKARDIAWRDKLLSEQPEDFQIWCKRLPFKY